MTVHCSPISEMSGAQIDRLSNGEMTDRQNSQSKRERERERGQKVASYGGVDCEREETEDMHTMIIHRCREGLR